MQQLILEPAEHLFPNCKSAIWKLAKNNLLLKLHLEELGLVLGIYEWTQDLSNEVTNLSDSTLDEMVTTIRVIRNSCDYFFDRSASPPYHCDPT